MIKFYLRYIFYFLGIFCFYFTVPLQAQTLDFGNLKNAKIIKVTGGLNINNLFNSYVPVATQKNSYFVNGTLNFNVLGLVDIPLNINYSNRKFQYSQPFNFNQISITPRYKWATGYFGTTAMTFSPYTLNGHQFSGAGVELNPSGKWQVAAMSGRLFKSNSDSTFNRMGHGVKLVYNQGKYRLGLTYFQAGDQPSSVSNEALERAVIRPQKNVVLGLSGRFNLEKLGQLDLEYSQSFIGSLLPSTSASVGEESVLKQIFFNGKGIVTRKNAFKSNLSRGFFRGKTILGLGYERVDPGYRTFGGYFFTEDFENITVNASQRLFENKLTINGNIGRQRDLLETKANGQTRFVASTNLLYVPSQKLNVNFSFSNFRGFVFVRDLIKEAKREANFIPIDTLNYTQINRNAMLMVSYVIKESETITQQVSVSGNVLDAANKQGETIRTGQASQVYIVQSTYTLGFPKKKINISAGYNFNQNKFGGQNILTHGPTTSVQQQLAKDKLTLSLVSTILLTQPKSSIFTASAMASYRITKNSNLNGNLLLMNNNAESNTPASTGLPATIYTSTLGFSYKF